MARRRNVYVARRPPAFVRRPRRWRRRREWIRLTLVAAVLGLAFGGLWGAVFLPVVVAPQAPGAEAESARCGKLLPTRIAGGSSSAAEVAAATAAPPAAAPAVSEEAQAILAVARAQLEAGVRYSSEYFQMGYPGGDIPADVGTSADLLVRALRGAGVDLQEQIQIDRELAPDAYPTKRWKRAKPDRNVDHRRLANIRAWLDRHAESCSTSIAPEAFGEYLPGDIVMWSLRDGRVSPDHAGVVSDAKHESGAPLVIDLHPKVGKVGAVHAVDRWGVRGHWRLPKPPPPSP